MPQPNPVFTLNLRIIKESRGLSAQDIADKAKLSLSFINHLLAGAKAPSWESVCQIADALSVSVGEFRRLHQEN